MIYGIADLYTTFMNGVADLCNFSTIVPEVLKVIRETSLILEVLLIFDMKVHSSFFKAGIHSYKLQQI